MTQPNLTLKNYNCMISAKDLRIGNLVSGTSNFDKHPTPAKVVGIGEQVDLFAPEDKSGKMITWSWDYDLIHPIPLTPSILEKCGFVKHGNSNEFWNLWNLKSGWYISEALHNEPSAGVKKGFCYWSDNYIELKYLHEIQNLYHALYRRELEINP